MKLYNKTILTAALGIMLFSSCDRDLLNPVPQTAVADATAFSTPARIEGQLLGLYGALKGGTFYGGRFVIYGDIRGEDFLNETSNLVTGSDVWALNPTNSATAVQGLWSQAYFTINSCNVFLEGMANEGNAVIGSELAANYNAEAKLIRAVSYMSLMQYYSKPYVDGNGNQLGVPLRITAIKGTGQSPLVRSAASEVYSQIIADLNDAEAGLPPSYSSASDNVIRAHRNTAIALKTRLYLSMQQYDNVITEANKIVSGSAPFTASSGVAHTLDADITTHFTNYTSLEAILSMPMTTTAGDNPGVQNGLAYYFSPNTANGGVGNGEYSLNPAGIMSSAEWLPTDDRRTFIIASGSGSSTKYWQNKYKLPSPFTDYAPVIRYAEILLSLAESRVRTTNMVDAQAVALLSAVRNRSDASVSYTTADFANSTELINAILNERRIEFLGEGMRNFDLLRLLQTIPAKGTAQSKSPSDAGYIWPISATELSLNTLAVDN